MNELECGVRVVVKQRKRLFGIEILEESYPQILMANWALSDPRRSGAPFFSGTEPAGNSEFRA